MVAITLRADLSRGLTNAEIDANFTNLKTAVEAAALSAEWASITGKPTTLAGYGITDAQPALVSGTSIKTVNGQSVLGSGNIQIDGGVTSFNTRTGAVSLTSSDVTTALGFTPYNSTNPSGYITSSALSSYLPLSGGTLSGDLYAPKVIINANSDLSWGGVYGGGKPTIAASSSALYFYPTGNVSGNTFSLSASATNSLVALQQNGNQVLHAGNYTSYAAAVDNTVQTEGGVARSINGGNLDTLTTTGFWRGSSMTGAPDTGWWYVTVESHDISGSAGWVHQRATAYGAGNSYPAGTTFTRVRQGGSAWEAWVREIDSSNYSSYALPLSGGTLSGSIYLPSDSANGIFNAAGNAGYRPDDQWGNTYMFNQSGAGGWYGDFSGYYFRSSSSSNWMTISGSAVNSLVALQQSGNQVLHAGNYASYSPTLTGTGASGTWGISITGNAATATNGLTTTNYSQYLDSRYLEDTAYVDFTVGGDANTYYPVWLSGSKQYAWGSYNITRGYSWTAPTTWHTSTHKGGLTLGFRWSGDTGWGGNDHRWMVEEFSEQYSNMVGGMVLTTSGMIVFLRGGTAQYRYYSPAGDSASVAVYLSGYTASNGTVYAARTNNSGNSEVYAQFPLRSNALALQTDNYSSYALPLSGGTVSGTVRINSQLQVGQNTNGTAIIDAFSGIARFGRDSTSYGLQLDGNNYASFYNANGYLQLGPLNTSYCHFQTDRSQFYFNRQLVVDGNIYQYSTGYLYLNSSNYSSYALPLGGGTLTGALTINNGGDFVLQAASGSSDPGDLVWRYGSGAEVHRLWDGGDGLNYRYNGGTGYKLLHAGNYSSYRGTQLVSPNGASVVAADSAMPDSGHSFIHTLGYGPSGNDGHILGMTWASTTSIYGAQIWVDTDPNNRMAFRSRSSTGAWTGWNELIHSSNYTSYSPSLTGSGASGTWGINISGSAETVDGIDSSRIVYGSNYRKSNSDGNMNNTDTSSGFWYAPNPTGSPFGDWTHWINCIGADWNPNYGFQLAHAFHSDSFAVRRVTNGSWGSWRTIITDSNYSGYALPLSGGSVSGAINLTNRNNGILVNASGTSSAGGAIAIQQVTSEGWTGIFCDFEPYTGWGLWHDNPNNYFSFTSENSIGSLRSFTVPSRYSGDRTAYEKFRIDQNNGNALTGGTHYAYGYRGHSNVAGTGEASYHPAGVYSTGTNWLYGTVYLNGNSVYNANLLHLNNGFQITQGASSYGAFSNWVALNGAYGFYSPTTNGAHFYPNDGSYGAWQILGARNGWGGLEFRHGNNSATMTLMVNEDTYGFHRNGTGWRFYVESANGYFPGNVTAYWSDERLKTNLRQIGREALSILGGFRAHRYNWNEKVAEYNIPIAVGKEEIGLIAQHVQRTLADAVVVNKAANKVNADGSQEELDYLTINYDRITPLVVEAVNIHEEDITELKAKIAHLEALVAKLIGD